MERNYVTVTLCIFIVDFMQMCEAFCRLTVWLGLHDSSKALTPVRLPGHIDVNTPVRTHSN